MQKSGELKNVVILFIVVVIFSVLCLTKHQNVRLTADSMLYFSLAEKYLAGDFANAINGYWGPLLAWLIIPFLYMGISDVLTINLIDMTIGVLLIIGVWRLSYRFEITDKIRSVLMVALLPIVLKFSIVQPMDFLLVCILIFYLGIIFKADYPGKISSGFFAGSLGAFAYLTKAYAFPFFIVHFFIMNILHYFRGISKEERAKVLRNAVAGFVLFFLISGAWIMVISDKYGHATFSTMRDTNFNAPGPEAMGGGLEFGVPVFSKGFYPPPNETAFVVWEDPSYLRGEKWSAWQSSTHLKHFIRLTLKNVSDSMKIFEGFSSFFLAIIISYILLLIVKPVKEWLAHGVLLYPLLTISLFSGGYLLFHLEDRYVWLSNILLLLMGGYVLTIILQKEFFKSDLRKNILIVAFAFSFIFVPSKHVLQANRGGMETYMHDVGMDLKHYNVTGNLASNREFVPTHNAWHKTFRLAYWVDGKYYGQCNTGQ